MTEGYVYILNNPELRRDVFKIGMTQRTPEERARELSSSSGVPSEYIVVYEEFVPDCKLAERIIHDRLEEFRVTSNREFFNLPLDDAIEVVSEIAEGIRNQYGAGSSASPSPRRRRFIDLRGNTGCVVWLLLTIIMSISATGIIVTFQNSINAECLTTTVTITSIVLAILILALNTRE